MNHEKDGLKIFKANKQDPAIELTENALKHIQKWLKKTENSLGVRLSIKETGCSGFEYVTEVIDTLHPDDLLSNIKDINIYVEASAYPYLKGVHLDYVKEGLNYKFVFNNPNASGVCGCGESFTVEQE